MCAVHSFCGACGACQREVAARHAEQLASATRIGSELRANLAAGADAGAGSNLLAHRVQRAAVREIAQQLTDIGEVW